MNVLTIPKELEGILVCSPDTLHGAIRFVDSRVFAQQLFDYILSGDTLEDFLDDFPEIPKTSAEAVLEWGRKHLQDQLTPRLSA